MPDGSDARGAVHVRTTIISARFAGMNRHAYTNRHITWPRLFLKCALNIEGRSHSVATLRENCEHTIAFATLKNDRSVMSFHLSRHDLIMPLERCARLRRIRLPCPVHRYGRVEQGMGVVSVGDARSALAA